MVFRFISCTFFSTIPSVVRESTVRYFLPLLFYFWGKCNTGPSTFPSLCAFPIRSARVLCAASPLANGVKNKLLRRLLHRSIAIGAGALELLQWGAPFPPALGERVAEGCAG